MKPIAIKNADGEIIEIKWDLDGNIQIKHSDIGLKDFAPLHDRAKKMQQPDAVACLKAKGVAPSSEMVKEMATRMGGYITDGSGETFSISAEELALIYETVKINGGIVPNWSSR